MGLRLLQQDVDDASADEAKNDDEKSNEEIERIKFRRHMSALQGSVQETEFVN